MKFLSLDNFRLNDRNKASGDAMFEVEGNIYKADFIFYLQGYSCLSIRLGRHDLELTSKQLQEYIDNNRNDLKTMVVPEIERVKKEREARIKASYE